MKTIDRKAAGGKVEAASQPTLAPLPSRRSILSHREARVALFLGDILAIASPLPLALAAKKWAFDPGDAMMLLAAVLVYWVLSIGGNLYNLGRASNAWRSQRATLCAALVVLIAAPLYRCPAGVAAFGIPYFYAFLAIAQTAVWRVAFAGLMKQLAISTKRMLVIGAGVAGSMLAEAMEEKKAYGESDYELVGFIDDDLKKVGSRIFGHPVLGPSVETERLVNTYNIDTLVLSINSTDVYSAQVFNAVIDAREKGISVVSMPALYERMMRKIPVTHVGGNWGVMFPLEHQEARGLRDAVIRAFDILVGIVGCILLGLLIPFVHLANMLGSPGPLFYTQLRVGKGGRPFRIIKFRSMVVNAEAATGAAWCAENDPRITKVGNLLRKVRLDEIPQFWNVLIGEMSLVGPRPERPEFVEMLAETYPFYRVRHAIKPGITGWAQVLYRYGASEEDSLMKLQYDLYYIKHRSITLDFYILVRTLKVVLGMAGR